MMMAGAAAAAVMLLAVAAMASATITLPTSPIGTVYDLELDPYLTRPAFTPNFTSEDVGAGYGLQKGTNLPEQVSLFPAVRKGNYLFVRWITPKLSIGLVYYGTSPTIMRSRSPCKGKRYSYAKGYVAHYVSGYIFFCKIGPLKPSTQYYYKIKGSTTVFPFKSLPATGTYPIKFGLTADVGQTGNSSITLDHLKESMCDFILFAGDVNYADNYDSPECIPFDGVTDHGYDTCGIGGLRWDTWGRLSQKAFAYTPVAYIPGNHEEEFENQWGEVEPYKAYLFRTPGLLDDSPWIKTNKVLDVVAYGTRTWNSKSPIFYSMDIGPAHIIGLSSYSGFVKYTHQDYWLKDDLCKFDRTLTPWLIVFLHAPWYNTDRSHYLEGEPMRWMYESYLYNSSADLVEAGHVHAYERSHPVYNLRLDNCGPTYVTVGDGGNDEGVAGPFLEPQPEYSAYRELSFGHATLTIHDAITAEYTWYRNQNDDGVIGDSFTLTNKFMTCGKKPSFC